MDRRRFLTAATASLATVAGCNAPGSGTPGPRSGDAGTDTTDEGTPTDGGVPSVGLATLATGFETPLDVAFPPGLDGQYVAEQPGTVRVVTTDGRRSTPLLDLRDAVTTGYEAGLLGIALHPDFAENRRLFVRYSAPPRDGTPAGFSHTFVLAEFSVADDGLTAHRDSERTVLEIPEPQANHNAGSIVFGPDGYLYVGVGDGGAGGDQGTGHVADWYDAVAGGNGQDVTRNLLGSILRIDVDGRDGETGYAVPGDNPLVGREGRDELYAWGFRNPWRLAFDGDTLYAGDVGQNRYEEVDRVRKGGNYGWNVREGTHCFGTQECPDATPDDVRGGEPLLSPVIEYPHGGAAVSGVSVIAGNVYRGDALPSLRGRFVFGDYRARGRLFVADPTDEGPWPTTVVPVVADDADALQQILSFGRHDGDLYVLGNDRDGGGGLHRLVPVE